ncbi:MAG: cell wall anchor protein [Paludibacteraceae bacterium]
MKNIFRFCLLFLLLVSVEGIFAQPVTVKAKMDSTKIWIGDQTGLTFQIVQKKGQKVQLPVFSDTIVGNLEIAQQARLDTVKLSGDQVQVNLKYVVTSFQDSLIYVPPVPFIYGKDTSWSNSMSLKVIQPFVIDTTKNQLADIKPVFKPKFDWKEFIQRMLLIFLVIALIVVLYFLVRKFVMKKPVFQSGETKNTILPPYIEALQRLDKIRDEKLWQKGRIKEYHIELTETLRIYIERMFNISSMEMTSEEILNHTEFLKVDKSGAFGALRQILTLADLVKFAKWNPSPNDNEMSLMNAYLFVNQTKIEETQPIEKVEEEIKEREK